MTPEELGQFLDELGKRLGPAGQHVYDLAIRQAIIEGVLGLLGGLIIIGFGTFLWRWTWRKSEGADSYDQGPLKVISSFAYGVLLIWGSVSVYLSLTILLNPEYAAIRSLLSAVSSVK